MVQVQPNWLMNLRGHSAGVTAICYNVYRGIPILVSGDQEGSIAFWDMGIFRKINLFPKICQSRIQSLRVIRLMVNEEECTLLLAQSRDHGIHVFNIIDRVDIELKEKFETYESLFSKGDAISISSTKAILAYPSSLESYLITIRFLGANIETEISGSAQRVSPTDQRKQLTFSVFDIRILNEKNGQYRLLAAFEDGSICCFSFCEHKTKTLPETGATGLDVDLIFTCDTQFKDFVSAFDIISPNQSDYLIVCGSPSKEIVTITCDHEFKNPSIDRLAVKNQGVSAIKICPVRECFALAYWNNQIEIRAFDRGLVDTIAKHFHQVQDIVFVEKMPFNLDEGRELPKGEEFYSSSELYYLCSASLDGTIGIAAI